MNEKKRNDLFEYTPKSKILFYVFFVLTVLSSLFYLFFDIIVGAVSDGAIISVIGEVIFGFVALWSITNKQKEIISYIFIGLTAIFDVAYYIMIINTLIGMIAVIFSLVGNIAYAAAAVMAVKMVYNKTKFYILIWGGLAAVVIGNCFANFGLLLFIVPYFLFRFCCLFTLWGPIKFRALHTCPHCGTFNDGDGDFCGVCGKKL